MNCNSVKEHLVDFLYDELPAEAREAFAEHVRGCAGCRAEVASYQKTLGSARAAMSGLLATEPPPRVHDAVMKAALAAAQAAHATPATARRAREPESGFFAELLRTPWLLPAFGAASVATVVFLVRVLKNPEVIPGQRPQSIEERAEPGPAAPAVASAAEQAATGKARRDEAQSAAAPAATEAAGARARERVSPRRRSSTAERAGGLDMAAEGAGMPDGVKAAPADLIRKRTKLDSDPLSGLSLDGTGSGAGSTFAEPPPPRHAASAGPGGAAKDESASLMRAKKASKGVDDLLRFVEPRAEPTPAKPMAEPMPAQPMARPAASPPATPPALTAAPPAAAPMPSNQAASSRGAWAQEPAGRAVPEPKPAARLRQAAPAASKETEAYADEPPPAELEKQSEDKKSAKGEPRPSLEESVRKADRLFAEQNWNAAAESYRDLLRRFPGHKDAAKWRARMDQSQVAERGRRDAGRKEAKAKKAIEIDTLDGLKL